MREWAVKTMDKEVRLIDANSVCKKIAESIQCTEEWINEAEEQQDTHGLRCAMETKTSLLAMLVRIHDEPTVEAMPVRHGKWIPHGCNSYECSNCHKMIYNAKDMREHAFCGTCGARMAGDSE